MTDDQPTPSPTQTQKRVGLFVAAASLPSGRFSGFEI